MRRLLLFFAAATASLWAAAQPHPAALFRDHAVLQRDRPIPVWGAGTPGRLLTVTIAGQSHTTEVQPDSSWRVTLLPHEAGGPFTLTINGEAVLEDLYFGDVWLCSGQSNMEWIVENSRNAEAEIAAARDQAIRHFKVPLEASLHPVAALSGGAWEVTAPETVGAFSAVGYYFARELRKHVDVPIGLLNASWGGSRIEAWMSAETLGYPDAGAAAVAIAQDMAQQEAAGRSEALEKFKALPVFEEAPAWESVELEEKEWPAVTVPGNWEASVLPDVDGVVWFRKTIELPESVARAGAMLHLGKIDDSDQTWINGRLVGERTQSWDEERRYFVPAPYLQPGENVIAVRVEDTGGDGGFHSPAPVMQLISKDFTLPLAGEWRYRVESVSTIGSTPRHQTPTLLYNAMIHPLLDFPVRGVLWYQGESNANTPEEAIAYRRLFPAMIDDWRKRWQTGDFPFLFVQLANYLAPPDRPGPSNWALLRESQSRTLDQVDHTAQVLAIDIGEADDIHPRNKQEVGRRLALAARRMVYGQAVVASGPTFKAMKKEGDRLRLTFDHQGGGLAAKDPYGYVKGFAVAGKDRQFYWAQARLEGNEVIVWSAAVPEPVAVRYAWADNPADANLYNREGLPATPFRTDGW